MIKHNTTLLLFPNQLLEDPLKNMQTSVQEIWLVEDIKFFTHPFKLHKQRLAFTRASCMWYFENVLKPLSTKTRHLKVEYIKLANYKTTFTPSRCREFNKTDVFMYDACDESLSRKYKELIPGIQVLNNVPGMFVLNRQDITILQKMGAHRLNDVFKYVKQKVDILVGVPSYDGENQAALPKKYKTKSLDSSCRYSAISQTSKTYFSRAVIELQSDKSIQHQDHIGEWNSVLTSPLPCTHTDAQKQLDCFISKNLRDFGKYQDAISSDSVYIHHSNISFLLNVGLIDPVTVAANTMKAYRANKVPLNSVEGFIRQVLGWREFTRYVYITEYDNLLPLFSETKEIASLASSWYNGTTGIAPIDKEIQKCINTAYAHHIIRLMVFLNILTLMMTPLQVILKWFSEMISIDAYEWVMWSNIAIMGYASIGKKQFSQKPYISASSYILKMSNYSKGDWCAIWDALFYAYIHKKYKSGQLTGGARIYLRNLKYFDAKATSEKNNILALADSYAFNKNKKKKY